MTGPWPSSARAAASSRSIPCWSPWAGPPPTGATNSGPRKGKEFHEAAALRLMYEIAGALATVGGPSDSFDQLLAAATGTAPPCRPEPTPGAPSWGPAVDAVGAALFARPLQAWQSSVNQVAGEYDPATGDMLHPVVVLHVPRRAGKTADILAQLVRRVLGQPRSQSWYTAQTGGDAGRNFRREWVPILRGSGLARRLKISLRAGNESFELEARMRLGHLFRPGRIGPTRNQRRPGYTNRRSPGPTTRRPAPVSSSAGVPGPADPARRPNLDRVRRWHHRLGMA